MRASADLYERTAAEPALALRRDQLGALPIAVAVFNTYGEAHDNMHTPQVAAMPPPSWPQPQPQPRLAAVGRRAAGWASNVQATVLTHAVRCLQVAHAVAEAVGNATRCLVSTNPSVFSTALRAFVAAHTVDS